MLRFEYITDDSTTEQGMLLDDISIPEINYSTDAETDDGGWIPEGWVRIDNSLPERYVVQMVQYGQATQISRLLGPADGTSGQWSIKVGGDVTEVVISVSGLTEFTTESTPFSYTLTNDSGMAGLGR
jgi:immune inhibitor A